MEYGTGPPRYPQSPAMNYTHHYYNNNRNMPLTASNGMRHNPREYPIGGPVGGSRLRGNMSRDEGENGQARRRIAVACARCRKRKIRCSGDPGDGTGCISCKGAGINASVCQFHRVGSNEATRVLDDIRMARGMMPDYSGNGGSLYSRASCPQLDTKAAYAASTWTVPYQDETSPVEAYNLDQPNAYLPPQNSMAGVYGENYRWNQNHEPVPSSVYTAHGLPYVQTNLQAAATSESMSPLNMTSLQLSLPGRTRPTSDAPQRQLPIPQPSPAQTTRNVVDQLQDRRLRSAHGFPKPALPYNPDDTQTTTTAESAGDSTMYLPTVTSEAVATSGARLQPQLNFSTSSLLDAMPAPALPTTYSNFRNYNLPTSSSTETILTAIARQNSQTNLYSFSPDHSSKRHSAGENDSALVSGHRYTPLHQSQSQPQHQTSLQNLRRDSFSNRAVSVHRQP